MRPVLAILLSLIFVHAMAQEVREFGDVLPQEFITDTTHSSIVLFNRGRYTVNGPYASFDIHIRVKLNSTGALAEWGDFKLGNNFSSITRLQAASYVLRDKKVETIPLEKENIYRDKKSGQQNLALPGLQENSIIEISYRVIYELFIVPFWNIQTTVPVLHSEYLSNAYPLTYLIRSGLKPTLYDDKYKDNGTYNRWVFKNVPAFKEEPSMPDPRNYYSRMEFWFPDKSWDETSAGFLRDYKKLLSHAESRQIKVEVSRLLDPITDPQERVKAIWSYIKDNYRSTGHGDILSDSPTSLYENKTGSSGDLNVLFYHLLELHDFKPTFLLRNTSGHTIKNLPSYYQFDHALCLIQLNGKEYYLDASDKSLPFHIVPQHCLGEVFVVLEKRACLAHDFTGDKRENQYKPETVPR